MHIVLESSQGAGGEFPAYFFCCFFYSFNKVFWKINNGAQFAAHSVTHSMRVLGQEWERFRTCLKLRFLGFLQ